jgi:mRNA-degrading endonuclease YafQ of YafQ-DinJ toxin-antitoxin module
MVINMEIIYKKSFKKDLSKQNNKVKIKFTEKLEIFKSNPFEESLNNHALK